MDKEYMIVQLRRRIKELQAGYKAACNDQTVDGRQLSRNGAGSKRAHLKKDIQILTLIEVLLINCTLDVVDNEDACQAFDKLVEPRSNSYKVLD